jgi:hypothetical protein
LTKEGNVTVAQRIGLASGDRLGRQQIALAAFLFFADVALIICILYLLDFIFYTLLFLYFL